MTSKGPRSFLTFTWN